MSLAMPFMEETLHELQGAQNIIPGMWGTRASYGA